MFGMMIETGPKLYVVSSATQCMTFKVKVTDLEFLYKSFVLIFFTISVFYRAFNGFYSCSV